jgi:predicted amidohydrolase
VAYEGTVGTHMYAPAPNGILDEEGRLFPDVAAARRRGVILDLGNGGNGHLKWERPLDTAPAIVRRLTSSWAAANAVSR